MKRGFESHHKCPCGSRIKCFVDNPWFKRDEPCSKCGRDSYQWDLVTERWVDEGTWFKPWTWGRGHYEKPDYKD